MTDRQKPPPLPYDEYRTFRIDQPHIGDQYRIGDLALVLHYTHGTTTRESVRLFTEGGIDISFGVIRDALPEFRWRRSCVFNYLQRVLGHGGYGKIADECYFESEPGLRADLDTHKPRKLLILGVTHWRPSGKFRSSAAIARDQLSLYYRAEEIMIETVDHPTSRTPREQLLAGYRAAWERLILS